MGVCYQNIPGEPDYINAWTQLDKYFSINFGRACKIFTMCRNMKYDMCWYLIIVWLTNLTLN